MVTKKDFLEAHIDKVKMAIFQNETLIAYKEVGGIEESECEKAKVSIEKDTRWLNFLQEQLNGLQTSNN